MTRCPTGFCGPFSVRLDTAYTATFGAKRRNLCTAGMQPTSLVSPIRPSPPQPPNLYRRTGAGTPECR